MTLSTIDYDEFELVNKVTMRNPIMDMLFDLRDRHGSTLVLVTHDKGLADRCDRIISLRDGKIEA